jgi:hypothetical protein
MGGRVRNVERRHRCSGDPVHHSARGSARRNPDDLCLGCERAALPGSRPSRPRVLVRVSGRGREPFVLPIRDARGRRHHVIVRRSREGRVRPVFLGHRDCRLCRWAVDCDSALGTEATLSISGVGSTSSIESTDPRAGYAESAGNYDESSIRARVERREVRHAQSNRIRCGASRILIRRAGTPPTTALAGTSCVTTALVPITALSPTVTPRRMHAP